MVVLTFLTLAASLVGFAAADFQITQPSADLWWVAQSTNTLAWTCKEAPANNFTILISNPTNPSLAAPLAIVPIQDNSACSKSLTQDQTNFTAGTGYQILLANTLNITDIYAQSQQFEIKPLGSAYPTATPAAVAAGPSSSGSSTASGGAASPSQSGGAASLKTLSFGLSGVIAAGIACLM